LDNVSTISAEILELAWTPPAGSVVENYLIERSDNAGGPFTVLTTVTGETNNLTDTGLSPAMAYYYRVTALNQSGESAPSNVLGATTKSQTLAAPANVTAILNNQTEITITWDPGPAGATAIVEWSAFGETEYSLLGTASADGSYTFSTGEPNAYTFRVKFVQGDDESPYAYSLSVVIQAAPPAAVYLPLISR
jgi:hypothetical protein